jgi:hypothetical protein
MAKKADQYAKQTVIGDEVGSAYQVEVRPVSFYKDGVLRLNVYASSEYANRTLDFSDSNRFENYGAVEVSNRRGPETTYGASNAFGARATVTHGNVAVDKVMLVNRKNDSGFIYRAKLDGPAAKRLAASVVFVLEGHISKTKSDKVGDCSDLYVGATISSPYTGTTTTCWAAGTLERAAFVIKETGQQLRAWSADSPDASLLENPEAVDLAKPASPQ